MIKKVIIRRFKRFKETSFEFPGHVVIAGPNNTGKTTALQAISAWSFSLNQWRLLNDFNRRRNYAHQEIVLPNFAPVSLQHYDWLWHERSYNQPIEIEIHHQAGWMLTMELTPDSPQRILVRPRNDVDPEIARNARLNVVFVPAMTGLSTDEEVHTKPRLEYLLGHGRPGEVLRNLLVEAHGSGEKWNALQSSIDRLFGYELLPPDATGARIISEYKPRPTAPKYDIASAGSGFQQVVMLLTFLNTRPASVLLLDEPDAHLHWILQDAILGELRAVAAREESQLIVSTHSEEIINSVDVDSICMIMGQPRLLGTTADRNRLLNALKVISNTDIMDAEQAKGILFVEDFTDFEILKAFAAKLDHPFSTVPPHDLVLKKLGGSDFSKARQFYEAITLVREMPALILLDRDTREEIRAEPVTGHGLQRVRWNRYEIESYLLHPSALARFVQKASGSAAGSLHEQDLLTHIQQTYPPQFLEDPFADIPFLRNTKARTELIPPALAAAGLPAFPYQRFHEIANEMEPTEIHPEVAAKLDAIMQALGL
jgi:hypothetical protein